MQSNVPRKNRGGKRRNRNKKNRPKETLVVTRYNAPPRLKAHFEYTLYTAFLNGATTSANTNYNVSYPIKLTGSANVVPGFGEFFGTTSALYYGARVYATSCTITATNLDSTTAPRIVAVYTMDNVTANTLGTSANQNPYAVSPWAKQIELGISTGASSKSMTVRCSLRKMLGQNFFVNNDTYSLYVAAGAIVQPTTPLYLMLMLLSNANTTSGVELSMRFRFDVEFYQRATPTS